MSASFRATTRERRAWCSSARRACSAASRSRRAFDSAARISRLRPASSSEMRVSITDLDRARFKLAARSAFCTASSAASRSLRALDSAASSTLRLPAASS
eukprot:4671984-Prymnesium_polylepis.1